MSVKPPPYYTLLNPPLPSVLVLPKVRIDNKIQIDHADCLKKLRKYTASLGGTPSFWIEVAVLDKLHYKHLNQQRPFHRFKRGMEIRRIVKRLKALALDKELERLYLTFWDAKTLEQCQGPNYYIPTKESIHYTMHKVIGAALLLDKLKVTLLETYRANSTLLKLEHFVSMALVYMGICSRLYVLSHDLLTQLNECYQILLQWSKSFPSGFRHKEKIEFAAANNLECDKDTLKKARNQFAENRLKSKSCHQHKIHLESYMANPAVMEKVLELKKELNIDENADDNLKEFEDLGEIIQR